jgi:hypothetical protein
MTTSTNKIQKQNGVVNERDDFYLLIYNILSVRYGFSPSQGV